MIVSDKRITKLKLNLKIGIEVDDKDTLFSLEIKMQSDFYWKESLPEKEVKILLQQNAPSLLLSYIRPIVSEIMGYGFQSLSCHF